METCKWCGHCENTPEWINSEVYQYGGGYKSFKYCKEHAKDIKRDKRLNSGKWELLTVNSERGLDAT